MTEVTVECRCFLASVRGLARKTLERNQLPVFKEPFRLVVSHAGEPLNLAKATCTRTRWPNGRLMEIVNLNGGDYGLGEEQLG